MSIADTLPPMSTGAGSDRTEVVFEPVSGAGLAAGGPVTCAADMPGDAAANTSQSALEAELKTLIVEALKLEDTSPEDIDSAEPLVGDGLGLDSIDILELAMAVHRQFGVKTGADDSENREVYASVSTLAAFILEQKAKAG